jgi:hypothetical protein
MRPSPTDSENRPTAALRQITADQLLELGTHQVVYLRAGMGRGERMFVLYGADGVPLLTADDLETVAEVAMEQGFEFVSVHLTWRHGA